jgi:hypothetical protein
METTVLQAQYHQRFTDVTGDVTPAKFANSALPLQRSTGVMRTTRQLEARNRRSDTYGTPEDGNTVLLTLPLNSPEVPHGSWGESISKVQPVSLRTWRGGTRSVLYHLACAGTAAGREADGVAEGIL